MRSRSDLLRRICLFRFTAETLIDKKCRRISGAVLCFVSVFFLTLFCCPLKASAQGTADPAAIISYAFSAGKNVLTVSSDGTPGCFGTISEAVMAASDGDIIVILPGEYEESLDLRGRDLTLWGTDSSSCIIKFDTSRYTTPVLNISSGSFINLTVYGYRGETREFNGYLSDSVISPDNMDDYYTGYAVHIDDDSEYGRSVAFIDCNIISENNNCLGIGLRDRFSASFDGCTFISTGHAGILYVHDPDNVLFAGQDMHLYFRNNIWKSFGGAYAVYTKSMYYGNRTELTFQNVAAYCYAVDSEFFYTPLNVYNGPDVRVASQVPGFYVYPVYPYACGDSAAALKALRSDPSCAVPGIYYIGTGEQGSGIPFTAAPFYVTNPYDIPGAGWIGSATFYLSGDSCGNTLWEMNR